MGGKQPDIVRSALVVLSSSSVGRFPVWLCHFLLQFVIVLPSFSLPVKLMPGCCPTPVTEWVGLIARNLVFFCNASKSPVLVRT